MIGYYPLFFLRFSSFFFLIFLLAAIIRRLALYTTFKVAARLWLLTNVLESAEDNERKLSAAHLTGLRVLPCATGSFDPSSFTTIVH